MLVKRRNERSSSDSFSIDNLWPPPGGSVVSMSDSLPGGNEFDTWLRQTFFPAYYLPLTSAKAFEKSCRWLWKESCVSTGERKSGNTCASLTAMI